MTTTTILSMKYHLQQLETKSDLRMSNAMKEAINEAARKLNVTPADYKRLAISERLEKDLLKTK